METLETLSDALVTTDDIKSIVRTMKALSAVSIHQYERAEDALSDYARTIDLGLSAVLRHAPDAVTGKTPRAPARTGREALIVIGSDRGLCGRYNESISRVALAELSGKDALLGVLGARIAPRLDAAGYPPDTIFAVPGSVDGINAVVRAVVVTVDDWTRAKGVTRVGLVHNRRVGQNTAQPLHRQLLPIPQDDLKTIAEASWPARGLPVFRATHAELLSWLLRERLFVLVYRALAEALASEHATRLAAMQSAERNIEERRDALLAAFRQKRQENITRELLDVVAGYETAQRQG